MKTVSPERFVTIFFHGQPRPRSRKRFRHVKRQRARRAALDFNALDPITTIQAPWRVVSNATPLENP